MDRGATDGFGAWLLSMFCGIGIGSLANRQTEKEIMERLGIAELVGEGVGSEWLGRWSRWTWSCVGAQCRKFVNEAC